MPSNKTVPPSPLAEVVALTDEDKRVAAALSALLPEPLEEPDRLAFLMLVAKSVEWRTLRRHIAENGVSEFSPRNETTHLTPEARREAEVFAEVIALCKEFGMTPRSRARMAAALGKKDAAAAKKPVFCGFISADPGKPTE